MACSGGEWEAELEMPTHVLLTMLPHILINATAAFVFCFFFATGVAFWVMQFKRILGKDKLDEEVRKINEETDRRYNEIVAESLREIVADVENLRRMRAEIDAAWVSAHKQHNERMN